MLGGKKTGSPKKGTDPTTTRSKTKQQRQQAVPNSLALLSSLVASRKSKSTKLSTVSEGQKKASVGLLERKQRAIGRPCET